MAGEGYAGVTISAEMYEIAGQIAAVEERSRSKVVERAIREYAERHGIIAEKEERANGS